MNCLLMCVLFRILAISCVKFFISQCKLDFTDCATRAIAMAAMERKTGARGLRAIVVSHLYYLRRL